MKDKVTMFDRAKWMREWIAKRRAAFFADKKCERCGSTERMELHHIDPSQKVDHKIWSWAESRRLSEIAKCIILCRNCHEKHHAEERRTFVHGIATTYKRKGCRCELCRKAQYATMKTKKEYSGTAGTDSRGAS